MTDDEIKEACRLASEVLSVEDRFSPGFIATDARFLASALLAVVAQRDSALEDAEFFRHAHNASEDKRSRTGIEAEQRGYQRALDEVAASSRTGATVGEDRCRVCDMAEHKPLDPSLQGFVDDHGICTGQPVDWRARALAAEAALAEEEAESEVLCRLARAGERARAVAYLRGRRLLNDADRIEAGEHLLENGAKP